MIKRARNRLSTPAAECAKRDVLESSNAAEDGALLVIGPDEGLHAFGCRNGCERLLVQGIDTFVARSSPAAGIEVAPDVGHRLSWQVTFHWYLTLELSRGEAVRLEGDVRSLPNRQRPPKRLRP